MQKRTKKVVLAISTLAGTIIGVGLFALPYITSKVGFKVMLLYFLIVGGIVLLVHILFSEVATETPDFLRLPGYARVYFGEKGEKLASILSIVCVMGAILAYLIVGGEFLSNLLIPILGGNNILYTFLYFALGATLIYFGIKAVSRVEFWGLILFIVFLFVIFLRVQPMIQTKNLFPIPNISYLFFPYGAVLFSLWGLDLIPEAEEMLGKDKKLLKKIVIPIAILISILVYIFFIYLILGVTGYQTTESAITGLKQFLGDGVVTLGLLFGITTTFTSFLTLGLTLKKTLWYDLKIGKKISWALTCFIPFILFLIGAKNFINVISFVGGVMLATEGILIILMYQKLKKPSKVKKILVLPLILIFILGIIYEIIYFIKIK
jgi:tyrosine-specific transport protein